MIYGYCRISTKKQSIERQEANIKKEYPAAVIVKEVFTGTNIERPKWNNLYRKLKAGDLVVFDEVSRMSRDAEEGYNLYEELYRKGVALVFLKEPHINTDVYQDSLQRGIERTGNEIADIYIDATNKVLMILARKQIQLAFEQAQKEVDYLHLRTKEGIAQARLAGKQIGQLNGNKLITKKSVEAKEIIRKHNKAFGGNLSDKETYTLAGINRKTFYKYKKELKQQI